MVLEEHSPSAQYAILVQEAGLLQQVLHKAQQVSALEGRLAEIERAAEAKVQNGEVIPDSLPHAGHVDLLTDCVLSPG